MKEISHSVGQSATNLKPDVVTVQQLLNREEEVSLTGQCASVDEDLTGHENLVLVAQLLGLSWRQSRERAAELQG